MRTLREIIDTLDARLRDAGVPKLPPYDPAKWTACKMTVDKLTPKYNEVVKNAEKNNPFSIRVKKTSKGSALTITKTIEGFDVVLQLSRDENDAVKSANYYAFNSVESVVYMRQIV